jgi:hypothetical protein
LTALNHLRLCSMQWVCGETSARFLSDWFLGGCVAAPPATCRGCTQMP